MRIKKNTHKKVCDMVCCNNIADYCIYYQNTAATTDICNNCLSKLYRGIKKVFYEKKSQKK